MKFNMFGHAVYQLIVVLILVFAAAGEVYEVPDGGVDLWTHCDASDWVCKYDNLGEITNKADCDIDAKPCVACGGFQKIPSGHKRPNTDPPTQHYTMVFNAFVLMTLFNWINCRKLYHEFNAFRGIQNNKNFCILWCICFFTQFLLIEVLSFGKTGYELACTSHNAAFKTTHLTVGQWLLCLLFGVLSLPYQWLLIVIAKAMFPNMGMPEVTQRKASITSIGKENKGAAGESSGSLWKGSGQLHSGLSGTLSERTRKGKARHQEMSAGGKRLEKQRTVELYKQKSASKDQTVVIENTGLLGDN